MSPYLLYLVVPLAVVAGTAAARWLVSGDRKLLRAMRRHPLVVLPEAEHGATVRLRGHVVAQQPVLHAPFQHRPCVGYGVAIHRALRTRAVTAWELVGESYDIAAFVLRTPYGSLAVDAEELELVVPLSVVEHSSEEGYSAAMRRTLEEHRVQTGRMVLCARALEGMLVEGDEVEVLGRLERDGERARLTAPAEGPAIVRKLSDRRPATTF